MANKKSDDANRVRFEKWIKTVPGWSMSLKRRTNGDYYYDIMALVWAAWRAAIGDES